ncbi:hypothetical protein HIM_00217 [Hirsutella minnesotensis 3608]|nr:hypothetical protein HIM_00217 [Hirsutella minnesotensis 3608]
MRLQSVLTAVTSGLVAHGCLHPEELHGRLQNHIQNRDIATNLTRRDVPFEQFPIGRGDRFRQGRRAPRGLGARVRNVGSILNVEEMQSGLRGLANAYPEVQLFTAPHVTYEKRSIYGATIGGHPRVFLLGGIHARERGGPDYILYFISDLLAARREGTGLVYGNQRYSHGDVLKALSAGVVLLPLANPDGVAYDQQTDSCWRKNRSPESASDEDGIGVDLNRNFDMMWDYPSLFSPDAEVSTSTDPRSLVYRGRAPASEPEVQNVVWVMDRHPELTWFLDLHSNSGDILFAWGDDDPQTTDPGQNFLNKTYDGKRGLLGKDRPGSEYREFMEAPELALQIAFSQRMRGAMSNAGTVQYKIAPASDLYPTSGASTDYAQARYYGFGKRNRPLHSLTVEFGRSTRAVCRHYPDAFDYHDSMVAVASGLMELMLEAASE